jgi:hypothetical protein
MKGIVVTTDLEIRIEEFSDPLYKTVGSAVGGYIEHVKPARLRHPYCMIVNEEGRLLDLPLNYVGSYFYGTDQHGEPIVGNIVIMKDGYRNGEPDIVGLDDSEVERVKYTISTLMSMMNLQPKGDNT